MLMSEFMVSMPQQHGNLAVASTRRHVYSGVTPWQPIVLKIKRQGTRICSVPPTRTAVVIDGDTPPGEMRVATIPMPPLGNSQILIKVSAVGVNAIDWFMVDRVRSFPYSGRGVCVPGRDVSGVVAAVGSDVDIWKEGDEVFGMGGMPFSISPADFTPENLSSGSYATFMALDAALVARKPDNISHSDAAGVPLVGLTAWKALVDTAKLQEKSKVMILGGAGGVSSVWGLMCPAQVGTIAIQLAKIHCKASTVVCTASEQSSDLVMGLGADRVIDYKRQDFASILKGQEFDCVVDAIGYNRKCFRSSQVLKAGSGILVDLTGPPSLGHLAKDGTEDNLIQFGMDLFSNGSKVRYELVAAKANRAALQTIATYMKNGSLRPVTDTVFNGLTEVQEAFNRNKNGLAHGKLVINVEP